MTVFAVVISNKFIWVVYITMLFNQLRRLVSVSVILNWFPFLIRNLILRDNPDCCPTQFWALK